MGRRKVKARQNAIDKKVKEQSMPVQTRDGFDNFASRVGLNNSNQLSAGMYTFNLVTRNRIELEAAYRGSWIVGQIINSKADDMTRAGIDIITNDGDEDIPEIQTQFVRRGIWNSLNSNIRWGDLYGGSVAVLQIDGQDLATPLDITRVGIGQFKGLTVFDRWQLNPVLTSVITKGPMIGLPEYYSIVNNPLSMDPISATPTGELVVHYSRCIRATGIELPYYQAITEMMWGESVLERLWDRLISFDQATMSAANLIERANNRTIQVESYREILAAGGKAYQAMVKQFEVMRLYQSNEGLTITDKLDEYKTDSYTFTGLPELLIQFGQQLAGASGIPLIRLFGQSPAGMNATGESDLRMYYDNINALQEAKLRPAIELILKVMWRSTFGKDAPKDLDFSFVPLWQMSNLDKAAYVKSNTETILAAEESGIISRSVAMKELRGMSGDTGLFSNISDEDIDEAENDLPPMPEMTDPNAEPQEEKPKEDVVENLDNKMTMKDKINKWLRRK